MPFTRSNIKAEAGYILRSTKCANCAFQAYAPDTTRGSRALAIAEVAHRIAAISSCPAAAERRKAAADRTRLPKLNLMLA